MKQCWHWNKLRSALEAGYGDRMACVAVFSKALQAEYKSEGILIQVLMPYGVSTAMSSYQKTDFFTLSPEDFVKQALDYVTFGDQVFGTLSHEILGRFMSSIPLWLLHSDRFQKFFVEHTKKRVEPHAHRS